ncbi:hypothetical protein CEXT_53991 [Caerostris extrusa]|uniref:Uncharacterized protein n=1 Tax=Caerostris extrusa TaxID=172846 RepID=A0AAV4TTA1_CAEEX|nr:hypothetical protein CEXT_53991 [Caerostris extrusa]
MNNSSTRPTKSHLNKRNKPNYPNSSVPSSTAIDPFVRARIKSQEVGCTRFFFFFFFFQPETFLCTLKYLFSNVSCRCCYRRGKQIIGEKERIIPLADSPFLLHPPPTLPFSPDRSHVNPSAARETKESSSREKVNKCYAQKEFFKCFAVEKHLNGERDFGFNFFC